MLTFLIHLFSQQAQASENTWEVLAFNEESNLIAYKSSYYGQNGEGSVPVYCGYPDVPSGQGITLGIWSVDKAKTIQKWDIYSSVFEEYDCLTLEQAKKNLNYQIP